MFANFIEVFLLSVVQGVSEFIPVSSSAHLFLISEIYQFKSQALMLDISLHLGSLLAIIFYFHKDLSNILNDKKLFLLIVLGSLPLIVCGFVVLKTGIINNFRNIEIIAWMTFIFAILLFIADKIKVKKKLETNIDIKSIIIIGLFQIFALIPGASRAGTIITAARILKLTRIESTKLGLYSGLPTILGAVMLEALWLINNLSNNQEIISIILILLLSFFFAYLSIIFLMKWLKNYTFLPFVIYRISLGIIILCFINI